MTQKQVALCFHIQCISLFSWKALVASLSDSWMPSVKLPMQLFATCVELLRRDRRLTELIQRKKGALPAIFKYQTQFSVWEIARSLCMLKDTFYSVFYSVFYRYIFPYLDCIRAITGGALETGHHNSLAGSVHLAFDHWRSEASRLGPGSENP